LSAARLFLRAICEVPNDDSPRLIYADWLDEHGYSAQAEFIRTEVKIARTSEDVQDAVEEDMADELYRAGQYEWRWPLGASDSWRITDVNFHRGFAQEVTLSETVFLANAAVMFALHPLTRVIFTRRPRYDWAKMLLDASLTSRGRKRDKVPGALFPFLPHLGEACTIEGAEARFDRPLRVQSVVSRAAVAYGRSAAGLPVLTWPPLT
jgi:uncharacterized protein (TIGR02996 family)